MKFKSDIEVQAGLKDSSGSNGTSGQVLSTTGSTVSWINQTTIANDVQNLVKAGVAINKGQAVYVTGADGTNIIVGLASNTSEATSSKTLGLLNATVAINGMADVVQIGRLAGLNTIGATVGDPVWLGTNGNLIYGLANKPYAPAHLVFIGIVTRVNSNNGEIFVNVQNGFELKEIHDVDIITNVPINGDVLGYDGTLWVNKTIAEWLGFTPANASGTTNYVSKFTGSTTLGNSQIFDNGAFVGIGTTTSVGNDFLSIFYNSSTSRNQAINIKDTNASANGSIFSVYRKSDDTYLGAISRNGSSDALFVYGNDHLALGSGATERMRITSNGNVGIGTSSPSQKLTVAGGQTLLDQLQYTRALNVGGSDLNNLIVAGFYDGSALTNAPDSVGWYYITVERYSNADSTDWIHQTATSFGAGNDANIIYSRTKTGGTWTPWKTLTTSSDISGTTNYVSKFTGANSLGNSQLFDNGTNVGIGTTSPGVRFVNAGGPLADNPTLGSGTVGSQALISANGLYGQYSGVSSSGDVWHQVQRNDGNTTPYNLLLQPSGGNVGIGTTIPSYKTVIYSSSVDTDVLCVSNDQINADSLQHFVGISLQDQYSNGSGNVSAIRSYSNLYSQWGSTLTFSTTGGGGNGVLERMRINASGNVGIGTTTADYRTQIETTSANVFLTKNTSSTSFNRSYFHNNNNIGTQFLNFGSAYAFGTEFAVGQNGSVLQSNTTSAFAIGTSTSTPLYLGTNGTERMRITSGGNVGIGTSSPSAKLDVNGISYFNSDLHTIQGGGIFFNGLQNYSSGIYSRNLGADLVLQAGSSERMRITSSGNVGIGTSNPNASALLDVDSRTQGFLPPRMDTGQRDNIASPAPGLMIFNLDTEQVDVFTSSSGWRTIAWV